MKLVFALLLASAPLVAEDLLPQSPTPPVNLEENAADKVTLFFEQAPGSEDVIVDAPEIGGIIEEAQIPSVAIDFQQVFSGSPIIYTTLLLLSFGSVAIWLYTLAQLRSSRILPGSALGSLREKLSQKAYDDVSALCHGQESILFRMVASGIASRSYSAPMVRDAMRAEGKRASAFLWQKIALLSDIALIAPMLGLLGTVLGMFYAFYDLNRSSESISALFDGLGISVGTTVCGLVVAIVAMMFHSMAKYRLVRQLAVIETEATALAHLIDVKGS
jgi:biopolymer transport protein ExbB